MIDKNIQKVLFDQYISPLLNTGSKNHSYDSLLNLAGRAFTGQIDQSNIDLAKYYQHICEVVSKDVNFSSISQDLFSLTIKNQEYNAPLKVNRIYSMAKEENSTEDALKDIDEYKVLFEVFLRDFLTPIYVYTFILENKTTALSAKELFEMGTDKMLKKIEECIPLDGRLEDFTKMINVDIRNSIAHERWRILDDDKIELQPLNNGQTKIIILTKSDMEEYSSQIHKLIWVLRAGFFTYLDNVDFQITSAYHNEATKKEIESILKSIDTKVLKIDDFEWKEDEIIIPVENIAPSTNPSGEIYTPQGIWSIIGCIEQVPLADRCFGAISQILKYFEQSEKKNIVRFTLRIKHNGNLLGTYTFLKSELSEINKIAKKDRPAAHIMVDSLCKKINLDRDIKIEVRSEQTVPIHRKEAFCKELKDQFGDKITIL